MYNFYIDKDVKMKKFKILKNRNNMGIKQLDLDINDSNIGFSKAQIHDWVQYPLFLYDIKNVLNYEDGYGCFNKTLNMFYNTYMLFKSNIFTPLFVGVDWFWPYNSYLGSSGGNPHYMVYRDNKNKLFKEELLKIDNIFGKIYPLLINRGDNEILNRAVLANYWLYKARETIKPFDRMIFLNIALEALVNNSKNNITNQISIRSGLLIGETNEEQNSICSTIKNIYDQRSKLVHGSQINLKNYDSWYIQEIVRVLILKIISLHKQYDSPNELFQNIDKSKKNSALQKDIFYKSNLMFPECEKFKNPKNKT